MILNKKPLISSLLDTDAYKLYTQQAIYHIYNRVNVVVEFFCRSGEKLGNYIKVVLNNLSLMKKINLTVNEYRYLSSFSFFKSDYLNWLKNYRFNPNQISIYHTKENKLVLQIKGKWCEVTLWEVPLLALISELFYSDYFPDIGIEEAIIQLRKLINCFYKQAKILNIDLTNFKLVDFGTRRRFSREVQYAIVKELKEYFPYFIGTSNYKLGKDLKLNVLGTQSHEWFQAHQQICFNLRNSQICALYTWLSEYPDQLKIALTDCLTTDAFLKDFNISLVSSYDGLRHDSGDPLKWGEKAISHYKKFGIDPMTKTLIFSDDINFEKALIIYQHFYKRINLIFGIGTSLTCNIPKVKPLDIVIKLVQCNGKPVAKISDNPKKTICKDNSFIYKLRNVFNI